MVVYRGETRPLAMVALITFVRNSLSAAGFSKVRVFLHR